MATAIKPSKEAVAELKRILEEKGFDLQFDVSLCLSDFDKSRMRKGNNGKIYTNIVVGIRKEPDQWSRDVKVYESPTREDRENHVAKNYVGGGNMTIFVRRQDQAPTDEDLKNLGIDSNEEKKDDLPF